MRTIANPLPVLHDSIRPRVPALGQRSSRLFVGTCFGALVALSCIYVHDTLLGLSQLIAGSSEYSYIALVIPITVGLLWLDRTLFSSDLHPWPRLGVFITSVAALAMMSVHTRWVATSSLSVAVFWLVTFWISAFCLCFGRVAAKKAIFPLLFLFLLVPIPPPIMIRLVAGLQHASADAASFFYQIAGIPYLRHGQFFLLMNQQIEIARECSGIRSSIALFITGLVLAHLFLRTIWSKVLLALAILPLAILKNGFRIFVLSVLAAYVNPRFLSGPLHHSGGIVFFSVALGVLMGLVFVLRRLEHFIPRVADGEPQLPLHREQVALPGTAENLR